MEISLRKAGQIAQLALQKANEYPLTYLTSVDINSVKSVMDTINDGDAAVSETLRIRTSLYRAAYAIRALIGEANRDAGVDKILNEKALLDASEKALSGFDKRTIANLPSPELAIAQLGKYREAVERTNGDYYGTSHVQIATLTPKTIEEIAALQVKYRKGKTQLTDKLLAINLKTTIVVGDDDVSILKELDII